MPIAYALHIVEECAGGFAGWVTHVVGGSMSGIAFAANNAAFMLILVGLTTWTAFTRSGLAAFLLVLGASANLFWDFLFHLFTTVAFDRYSPGLLTAVLLYFPISVAVGAAALRDRVLGLRAFSIAVALGAGLMGFVIWYGLFHFAV